MSLQYKISSWTQIGECLSNTDRKLHARCIKIISPTLEGLSVRVEHDDYGCLFSYLVNGKGSSLSDLPVNILSTQTVLEQLKRFGFYIRYEQEKHVPGEMLEYLITLNNLGYDKIRILFVHVPTVQVGETDVVRYCVVAFKVKYHPNWVDNLYQAEESELTEGALNGTAINISAISEEKNFDWSFLGDYVLNIYDILEENSRRE